MAMKPNSAARTVERKFADVAIVGAGVIGVSIAWRLARAGASVVLLDRGRVGGETSSAAFGTLTPQSDSTSHGSLLMLARQSVAMYPDWVSEIEDVSGIGVEFVGAGLLRLGFDSDEAGELERFVEGQNAQGLPAELLSGAEVRALEPAIAADVSCGILLAEEPQVNNTQLLRALASAAQLHGVDVREYTPVSQFFADGEGGVSLLTDGSALCADKVVLAGGLWSGQIPGGPHLQLIPVRGQAVELSGPPRLFQHHLYARGAYVAPRLDGGLMLGATYDRAGYASTPTAGGVAQLLAANIRVAPALADLSIRRVWAGLRADTPDHWPLLGETEQVANVIVATGHYGLGFTLAPATAEAVHDLIVGSPGHVDLSAFAPDRFA